MPKKADIGSKRLISLSPNRWVQWVTQNPNLQSQAIFSSGFEWVSREGDVLIRATSPETGEILIANEVQLYYTNRLPRRIRAYTALAEEKYQLPVYPVLINILPPNQNPQIPTSYQSNCQGLIARQDYRVINLWEVEAQTVFEQQLTSLLPFVPILAGGNEEATVRQALAELRESEALSELENLLAFFATFVLDTEVVRQIMRWDMAVLRQSPWYEAIKQEGRQEGLQAGSVESLYKGIEIALKIKFGAAGLALLPEIRQIQDVGQLEAILEALESVDNIEQVRELY
ncbi:MAG: Rpn family recombination-promoting nuclease/putative transposase [Kamptonema sp. SIO4C4]|nr:Rpn family recombination-promoting nuclease/putative transposase [Kamptonema sp. SIO4C4]